MLISFPLTISFLKLNCLTTLILVYCLQFCNAGNNETDRLALYQIKTRIPVDPLGIMSSWNDSLHFCHWHGVTCGRRPRRVTVLNISASELTGTLSPFIGNLSFLRHLVIDNNSFFGTVPPEIGRLQRPKTLALSFNSFEGKIPANLCLCSSLTYLELVLNKLVGQIPHCLGSLKNLRGLALGQNNLTGGIPSSLGNLTSLYKLYLGSNNLIGTIPESLGRLNKLVGLGVGLNKLSGVVPPSIFNLSLLTILDLEFNQLLEGILPLHIGTMLPLHISVFLTNNVTDRLALYEIKSKITSDPLGILSTWNESVHFCNWLGVTCGRRHRRVTSLYLYSSKLTGTLSPFVGNLSFLRNLYLYNNSFIGTIPSEVGRLHRLREIGVSSNSFGGEIPANLSGCSNLNWMSLAHNKLVGEIPPEFGSLKYLGLLDLENNNLRGVIPSSLANLTSLSKLYMTYNNLIGKIPESLGRLNKLLVLNLGVNKLSGVVPPSIFNLSLLTILELGDNQLDGILPVHIGTMLPNLQWFSIYSNNFTGSIPASINNCSNLQLLQLDTNSFQGRVPCLQNLQSLTRFSIFENLLGLGQLNDLDFVSCLANSTQLTTLYIGFNNFQGAFPNILCNFSSLSYLNMGNNRIVGEIPSCIENLASLQVFGAQNNKLSGVIPLNIGKLQNLAILYLSSNKLLGHIPSSIGNLTQLFRFNLADNNFTGRIPSTLGNCRYLIALDLSQNNLGGRIPPQLFNLSLQSVELFLSQNPLRGSLPREVGQLKNLVILGISHTKLSGEIPSTMGDCLTLKVLYMSGNHFQGVIPNSFAALRGLEELDLSGNNLSGKVPKYLVDFPLRLLKLSYNEFEGELPIGGVFNNEPGLSIGGNSRLCGGVIELNLPPCNSKTSLQIDSTFDKRLILAFVLGVFGFGLLVASTLLYVTCLKKRKIKSEEGLETSLLHLSYQEILKATNGFSSENVVGSSTFGTLYKAILDQGITIVAIKIFNLEQMGGYKSFMEECQVLKNVRHRNLVKVLTACSSVDYKGNDFKALVYEHMPKGSLEDWLHRRQVGSVEETSAQLRSLNLLQRVNITLDVAFALEYLHHHSGASITHCNLKPSNVLLDDEMVAHVGDFGLAKFISDGITSSHTNESRALRLRGTIGYAPPEYELGNDPSTKGDVYSFGILLLEMITGIKPLDDRFNEGLSLHGYVKADWPEHVMKILDHTILEDIIGEEGMNSNTINHSDYLLRTRKSTRMLEVVTSILAIALSCSVESPNERMDMRVVVVKLSAIKNKLLGTRLPRHRQILTVHEDTDCMG